MNRPLEGRRILVTRAAEQAAELAEPLRALGADVTSIPAIAIVPPQSFQPLDKALHKIQSYDWLILTSVNGVRALARRMDKAGMDAGLLSRLRIAAIGPATRDAAEKLGLRVTVVPDRYIAESVVQALRQEVYGRKVLVVRAKVARDVIPKELRAVGAEVDVAEAYETVVPVNSANRLKACLEDPASRPDTVTFTSSSTVKNFVTLLGKNVSPRDALKDILLASIGPVTSETLQESGLRADIEAGEYTIPGLVDAIVKGAKS